MEQRKEMVFSVIVVALNPGDKLEKTLRSIFAQEYPYFEIILKDGMSSDGSVERAQEKYQGEKRLRLVRCPDRGIYDAMNQALDLVTGDYVLFLNCGDTLFGGDIFRETGLAVRRAVCKSLLTGDAGGGKASSSEEAGEYPPLILYGDTFCEKTSATDRAAPVISGFTCYRNIPCHQSCFYDAVLFAAKRYNPEYRIRADYDHFLWCFYKGCARMVYLDRTVSSYEGGGYSESRENRKRDLEEHRLITREYMSPGELLEYRLLLALTLAPLRRRLAESKVFAGLYQKLKKLLYRKG